MSLYIKEKSKEKSPLKEQPKSFSKIFEATEIDSIDWEKIENGSLVRRFLISLVKNGSSYYVENIRGDIYLLQLDQYIFPILVNRNNQENSWVCSPYTHYIIYGKEYVGLIGNRFLAAIIKKFIGGIGKICKVGKLDSVVYINNSLFSTDLFPQNLTTEQIIQAVACLKKKFPQHAIIFRSLSPLTSPALLNNLQQLKFQIISSRQINVTNAAKEEIFQTRIVKSDLKLSRETPYKIENISFGSFSECTQFLNLYRSLYIAEHSKLNPQITLPYVQLLLNEGILKFKALKDHNDIIGVAAYHVVDGVMMCPFFGYDKKHPNHNVIYRLLSTALLLEAKKGGFIFNQSAGASFYKKIRRAESCLESMAVYTRHLPPIQRFTWSTLKTFINTLAPFFMKNY